MSIFLKLKAMSHWMKGGFCLGTLAALGIMLFAISEYRECSPDWQSMCGTGLGIVSAFAGLGFPLLFLAPVATVLKLAITPAYLSQDLGYIVAATAVMLGFFVEYFMIGSILGWIYHKLSIVGRHGFLGGTIAVLLWLLLYWRGERLIFDVIRNINSVPNPHGSTMSCGYFCTTISFTVGFFAQPLGLLIMILLGVTLGVWRGWKGVVDE